MLSKAGKVHYLDRRRWLQSDQNLGDFLGILLAGGVVVGQEDDFPPGQASPIALVR